MNGDPILLNQRERRLLQVGIDLETTSADPSRARIVQFAAVSRCPGWLPSPGVESNFLVDPGCPIPESATKIHRITDEMVRGKQTLAQRAPALLELLGKTCQPGACVVGFNVRKYDLPLLQHALAEMGFVAGCNPMVLDVLDLVSWYHRELPSRKLADVANYFGVPFAADAKWDFDQPTSESAKDKAHDALSDVRASFRVLDAIRERLNISDTHAGDLNLLRLAQIAAVRVDAEWSQYQHYVYRCRESWASDQPVYRFGFGKHCGKTLIEVCGSDPWYRNFLERDVIPKATKATHSIFRDAGFRVPPSRTGD